MTVWVNRKPLLLGTNILVHAVRGSATWQKIKEQFEPLVVERIPYFCVVTEGEILSIAEQRGWSGIRRNQMDFLLGYFQRLEIGVSGILTAYAEIDAYSRRIGINMGKNDLWIAATAREFDATILTTDKDFDHLEGRLLTRILVPEAR